VQFTFLKGQLIPCSLQVAISRPVGPSYLTALLFHSIFTGTLLHQKGTRLHQTTWRPPCVTTKQLSYPDPPWYKNQETITSRPPVKPWLLWGAKRRWRWFPHLYSASCTICTDS